MNNGIAYTDDIWIAVYDEIGQLISFGRKAEKVPVPMPDRIVGGRVGREIIERIRQQRLF